VKSNSAKKIGYILIRFPALRETFVLNEIVELHRQGIHLEIFSLSRPKKEDVEKINIGDFNAAVVYPSLSQLNVWAANISFILKKPLMYFKTIFLILKRTYLKPIDFFKSMYIFVLSAGIARQASDSGLEHIHSHFASHAALSAFIVCRLIGIKFSMTAHAYDLFKGRGYLTDLFQEAQWVVTISDFNRQWIHKRFDGRFDKKTHVIHCGADVDKFRYEANAAPHNDVFTILYVAGMVPPKGHTVLLQAIAALKKTGVPVKCVLIGDGVLAPLLIKTVKDLKIEPEVVFLGSLSHSEVLLWLGKADCFVMPSVFIGEGNTDGIPVVLMEALASGVPVIASRISGIPELVIDGQTGFLSEPGNVEDVVEKIILVKNASGKLETIRENGRKKVEESFNLKKNVNRVATLLLT
jgi:colanic acid/amylovoran biosynthesis glycosyltransferase